MTADPDEETTPVRRAGIAEPADEATAISGRRATPDAVEVAPAPGPRRSQPGDADDFEPLDDDGSTVVARRESRRRQQRADAADAADSAPGEVDPDGETAHVNRADRGRVLPSTLAADVPAPLGRVARTPDTTPASSPVRTAAPVVVPRAAPAAHEAQELVDTAADESARRSRSRRTTAIVVAVASLLAVCAAVALIVLLTTA